MIENYKLENGVNVPILGYGTWQIQNGKEVIQAVKQAIEVGYRHIDTAGVYGNEEGIGIAIKESKIEREKLFIASKLSNDDRGYETTIKALESTLEKLRLDYLDLYLIHWPAARGKKEECDKINIDTWRALEYLYKNGKIKAIGVSNFLIHHLKPILETCEIKPMVNQIEYHPGQMQNDIVEYCINNNILVEAWSPLGTGKMLENMKLQEIAKKYNKSVAQLCIRWCIQNKVLPITKTINKNRMLENIKVFDFNIAEKDMQEINNIPYFAGSGLHPDKINF